MNPPRPDPGGREVGIRVLSDSAIAHDRRRRALTAGRCPQILRVIIQAGDKGITTPEIAKKVGAVRAGLNTSMMILYGVGFISRTGTGKGRSSYMYTANTPRIVEAIEEFATSVLATKARITTSAKMRH